MCSNELLKQFKVFLHQFSWSSSINSTLRKIVLSLLELYRERIMNPSIFLYAFTTSLVKKEVQKYYFIKFRINNITLEFYAITPCSELSKELIGKNVLYFSLFYKVRILRKMRKWEYIFLIIMLNSLSMKCSITFFSFLPIRIIQGKLI